jgi:iron complex outermembrane receptor protein
VRGLDFQADQQRPLLDGTLRLRLLGNYVFRQSQDQLGRRIDYAGGIGLDNPVLGIPRARAKFMATFDRDQLSVTAQTRFIGSAKLVNGWTGKDVDRNKVPAIAYIDLRAAYRINDRISLYATIDNVLNQDPPLIPGTSRQGQNVYYFTATRGDIYDVVGRSQRIGIRVQF